MIFEHFLKQKKENEERKKMKKERKRSIMTE